MTRVTLLHNPGAGNEDHSGTELTALLKKHGFDSQYSSLKKSWKLDDDADFIVAAGGDGSVRKITNELLNRKRTEKIWPIALLPLGTANNIAQTLGISGSAEDVISSWHHAALKKFDVGMIRLLPDFDFFLESFGFGIFPYLMKRMEKLSNGKEPDPRGEMQMAWEVLREIILNYEPKNCELIADGIDHSGRFLMVEVMNTQLIGPNLFLSPHGDPGDGFFDIILIPESDKEKLAAYVSNKILGQETPFHFQQLRAKDMTIRWEGTHVHVDDQFIKIGKNKEIGIEVRQGLLEFLVPPASD
jgi:diacylglycerol kinase (ATP)